MQNNDRKRRKEIPRQASLLATSQTGLEEETRWMGGAREVRGEQGEVEGTRSVGLIDVGLTINPLGAFQYQLFVICYVLHVVSCPHSCLQSLCACQFVCVQISEGDGRKERFMGYVKREGEGGRGRKEGWKGGRKVNICVAERILQFLKWVEPQYCWHVLAATG